MNGADRAMVGRTSVPIALWLDADAREVLYHVEREKADIEASKAGLAVPIGARPRNQYVTFLAILDGIPVEVTPEAAQQVDVVMHWEIEGP